MLIWQGNAEERACWLGHQTCKNIVAEMT